MMSDNFIKMRCFNMITPEQIKDYFTVRGLQCAPSARAAYEKLAEEMSAILQRLSMHDPVAMAATIAGFNQAFINTPISAPASEVPVANLANFPAINADIAEQLTQGKGTNIAMDNLIVLVQ